MGIEATRLRNGPAPKTGFWKRLREPVPLGAVLVFLATQVVYATTLTITCPFWDSGEFIATSYILGIPHPPGTPLYVLIGRIFSWIPVGMVATRINYLSAFASSLAAVFTYLVAVDLFRRWPGVRDAWEVPRGDDRAGVKPGWGQWTALFVGLPAAFFTAFGRTFWDNAVEAEVYGLSSFVMIFAVWLVLRWSAGVESRRGWEDLRRSGGLQGGVAPMVRPEMLVLIVYVLFLSISIHMGTFIVLPGIILFVAMTDPKTVFNFQFLTSFGVAVACILLFFLLMYQGLSVPVSLVCALALYGIAAAALWKMIGHRNYMFWFFTLGFLGVTVHLFLIIRAQLDPAINEADPSSWDALWKVLTRDQYKPPNPFVERQAPWAIQITKHFWRYAHDQYDLGIAPAGLSLYLPYALGLVGAVGHWLREQKGALLTTVLYLSTSALLIFYLNFQDDEVRDRDYFFVASYHVFAVWIGLGLGELMLTLRDVLAEKARRYAVLVGGAAAVILCVLPIRAGYFTHDRTDNWVARDYAYNMLTPLERDAILFTNGDNDTFPLWYLQEVEGIRKDVRVVNLSLLQTHWYIKQLRDYDPRVDLQWSDEKIEELRPFIDARTDKIVWVNDVAVARIVQLYYGKRPLYVAVTVPDQRGLDDRLVMEGLVFAVRDSGAPQRIDVEKTLHNLSEVYSYRGLLDEEGRFDESIYKDDNSRKLVQNYAAGWVRIAHQAVREETEEGKNLAQTALERARGISPDFPGVSYTLGVLYYQERRYAEAESLFQAMVVRGERDAQVLRILGLCQEAQGKMGQALEHYQEALQADPDDRENYLNLIQFLISLEEPEQALTVLDQWLVRHPTDAIFQDARRVLVRTVDSLQQQATPE